MYYQYKDTNFQRFSPQVSKFGGIKHKKLSYFRIFLITHCVSKKGDMKCLKSIQTIYFWKVLDKTIILK